MCSRYNKDGLFWRPRAIPDVGYRSQEVTHEHGPLNRICEPLQYSKDKIMHSSLLIWKCLHFFAGITCTLVEDTTWEFRSCGHMRCVTIAYSFLLMLKWMLCRWSWYHTLRSVGTFLCWNNIILEVIQYRIFNFEYLEKWLILECHSSQRDKSI